MKRRLALLAGLVLAAAAHAQGPGSSAPLHLVVPFAAGGAQDVIARYLGDKLGPRLGVPVIIDNKAGAGGILAGEAVARAVPDGNTVLLATGGAISIAPHLRVKMSYDPLKDFAPVALVADTPMTMAVRAASPYQSVADVIKDAKARPGQVSFASTGMGTVSHLTGELFAQMAGVQLLHVPYKGAAPAITDLLGGQVAMIVTSSASIDPMLEDRKVRVLASFTGQRLDSLKGAPTITQASGLQGLEVPVWVGVLAPAKTPQAALDRLAGEIQAICRLPETQQRFAGLGALTTCGGPRELDKIVHEDHQRWGKVIRAANIKPE